MDNYNLQNKTIIVTGGGRGLGRVITERLHRHNANVWICGREEKNLLEVVEACDNQNINYRVLDISDENQVENFVNVIIKKNKKIDALINNAGIYGPKGLIENITLKDFKKTIDINLFGSINFIKILIPHFKENNFGRIIQIAGGGATSPLPYISAYATAKVGIVRFIETVAEECKNYNITLNSIAPGILKTKMLDEIIEAGPDVVGNTFYKKMIDFKDKGESNPSATAELALYLISQKNNNVSGKIISAIWDNWKEGFDHELLDGDIWTLRRLIGKDRNKVILDK
jgi:3-oxoacyl-[acyl-carrier protein] reductase